MIKTDGHCLLFPRLILIIQILRNSHCSARLAVEKLLLDLVMYFIYQFTGMFCVNFSVKFCENWFMTLLNRCGLVGCD